MPNLHVADVGSTIRVPLVEDGAVFDASSATVKQIILTPPTRAKQTFTAAFETDGSDGVIKYVTTDVGDLPEAGQYKIQVYLEMPTPWLGHSEVGKLTIDANL